ncbi:class I adenylate-forming enzyme family protein [Massilia niastensis]|uniref:class I adenylate-forming enzyme family protein n=1 Tax=Massilia niastensis TaxID=544911 RepID=UPI00037A70F4|nr:class I adenylate-forming enzyme family protein [Massilia niastensis]
MDQTSTSLSLAWRSAWAQPDVASRTALIGAQGSLTYAELHRRVGDFAGGLHALGVRRGDLVGLDLERSLDAVVAMLGCICAGACPCPLEPRLSPGQVQERVLSVGIRWLLADAARQPELLGVLAAPGQVLGIRQVLDQGRSWWDEEAAGDCPALLLFTSGSTGKPKGVLLTHRNILNNARGVARHTGLAPDDRLLHVMPLHHTNAVNNQLFTPFLYGVTVILAGRFKADDMPALLETYRPTIITGVPTMYARMLELPFSAASLAALRFARCGSAPITADLHQRVEARLGCELLVSYGLSEATCTSTMNPVGGRKIGTVGTVLAGQTVVLIGANGQPVPAGQEGEVCVGGDSVMAGYLGADPQAADRAVQDGLLRTGDLGRFDGDGYLSITGRIKEVIIRGGENLSPVLIENAIAAHPDVAACCVVGQADADLGEVPVAFVVATGPRQPGEEAILQAVAARLPRIYRPHAVHFVAALPENSVGKVDRKAVAALLARQPVAA